MNFFKKNFIVIELIFLFVLLIFLLASILSFYMMWVNLGGQNVHTTFFDMLWMMPFGLGYYVLQSGFVGILIHVIFFAFLLQFPIIGFSYYRNKRKYIFFHASFLFLIIVLFIVGRVAYGALWAFAGV